MSAKTNAKQQPNLAPRLPKIDNVQLDHHLPAGRIMALAASSPKSLAGLQIHFFNFPSFGNLALHLYQHHPARNNAAAQRYRRR